MSKVLLLLVAFAAVLQISQAQLVCCTCPDTVSCTYTQGYWKNHNRYKTNPSQNISWPIDEDTTICPSGTTWYNILKTPPKGGDAWLILAHQYIAARLNVANGAGDDKDVILGWVSDAGDLLVKNCPTESVDSTDRPTAIELASHLDDFNNGLVGPRHCGDGGGNPSGPCPLSQGYWKTHTDKWPTVSSTSFCGIQWTTIWSTAPKGNAWYILAYQTMAALLNVANGADTAVSGISPFLSDAQSLLAYSGCSGDNPPTFTADSDISTAISLAEKLDSYNNGLLTPGCSPSSSTPDSSAEQIILGCTYTQGYWQRWTDNWPTGHDLTLCGLDFTTILATNGPGFYALAHQYVAAVLNIWSGAYDGLISDEMNAAYDMLYSHCADKTIAPSTASPLITALTDFNEGKTIVPHCGSCPYCLCGTEQVTYKMVLEASTTVTTRVLNFDPAAFSYEVTPSDAWTVTTGDNNDGTWKVSISAISDGEGTIGYPKAAGASSPASSLRPFSL